MKRSGAVPPAYIPLHKYLDGRFADTIVLTFSEIEDLLGFALPDAARVENEFWANGPGDTPASAPSLSWTQASRMATPNLPGRRVSFARE